LLSNCKTKIKSNSLNVFDTKTINYTKNETNEVNQNFNTNNFNNNLNSNKNNNHNINENNYENFNNKLHSSEKMTKLQSHQISEKTTQFLQSKTNHKSKQSNNETNNNNYNYNYNYNSASSSSEFIFGSARNIACTQFNCQYPNQCVENGSVCRCGLEFAEYELNKPQENSEKTQSPLGNVYCSYRKKNQLVYFLLELLLNVGAGHFYAGNFLLGGIKLALMFVPCVAFFVLACLGIVAPNKLSGVFSFGFWFCFVCLFSCGVTVWWLVDVILIATRKITDGNGVPLNPW
jgi:thiol:disulfide interchange protein